MPKRRSYKLLCPISRALDRVGDRWTLLILRDLLAGPARFSELQRGLNGIAANLLTDRLMTLIEDGLVTQQESAHRVSVYSLTDLGEAASNIILELALFGARFEPVGDVVTPGNLRTVATTIVAAAKRIVTPEMNFTASIIVDGEAMFLTVMNGSARMEYRGATDADLVFKTNYTALLDLIEGANSPQEFEANHTQLESKSPEKAAEFKELLSGVARVLRS